MTFWEEENQESYVALRQAIKKSAFKIVDLGHDEIVIKMKRFRRSSVNFGRPEKDFREFVNKYAKILWDHKVRAESSLRKQDVKELKDNILDEIEGVLKKHGISKPATVKAKKAITPHIRAGVEKQFEKMKKNRKSDYYFLHGVDRGKQKWKDAERDIIQEIKTLYDQYTPTPIKGIQRQTAYSIARVFLAVKFYGEGNHGVDTIQKYHDRLIKIFDKFE